MGLRATPLGNAACGAAGPRQLDAFQSPFLSLSAPSAVGPSDFWRARGISPRPGRRRAYAINPVASGGGFHLRYDGALGVTLSDEPQLLAVNLVRSIGSQALTGHYLVDMLL